MAAPTLHGRTSFLGSGTSISIPATATSSVTGDYRVMVVHTNDHHTSGQPTTVTPPSGWTFLYQSPRGRSTIRTWVYGQPWTPSVATGNVTLSANLFYAVTLGRLSGYTQGVAHPMVTTPAIMFGASSTSLAAGTLNCQGDSLRMDFWAGFYAANANSGTTVINVPGGQSDFPVERAATSQGYVVRLTYETRATAGYTGARTATMSIANTSAVVSLAIGGWKTVTGNTATQLATAGVSSATKAVTLGTDSILGLASSAEGSGHSVSADTTTALALSSVSQRVHLTSTVLDLQSTSIGGHHSIGEPVTALGLTGAVAGTHIAEPATTTTTLALTNAVIGRVGGGGPSSVVDQYTVQYVPPTKPLRFMLQNARTGAWINWDFPLVEPEISYTLSGATLIRGRIGPEDYGAITGTLDAWGTWVHVEEGGQIRASAIMQPFDLQGDDLMIEAAGVHAYAIGTQFESELSRVEIDAAEAMRELWRYLQSYTDSKLGVTLDPTNTGRLLGDPARTEITRDTNGNIVWRVLQVEPEDGAYRVTQSSIPAAAWDKLILWGYPIYINIDTNELVLYVHPSDYAMATVGMQARVNAEGEWEVPEFTHQPAKPYEIAWWNEVDVGREIENLAKQTPFDFAETPYWQPDRLAVQQHISIGYPRLGTKRFDLRFAEDENLLNAVLFRETPGHYASQVILRGAGEGRSAIRAQAGTANRNRFRRVASITDKTVTTRERATAVARDELFRRLVAQTIGEITIDATHPNAPMGAFALGDDILVQARLPYFGEVALWHRILGYTWRPDRDEVVLRLRRSEQFAYGRIAPT